jgi:NAD/NADP transhydrogenase beta subunit
MVKRDLFPGFAGIPSPLFAAGNAVLLFDGDKQAINTVNSALRDGFSRIV